MIFKPRFHVWLVWKTIDMLAGQHHITLSEVAEGFELYHNCTLVKNPVVIAPNFDGSLVRAGTPVESCKIKEDLKNESIYERDGLPV